MYMGNAFHVEKVSLMRIVKTWISETSVLEREASVDK